MKTKRNLAVNYFVELSNEFDKLFDADLRTIQEHQVILMPGILAPVITVDGLSRIPQPTSLRQKRLNLR